MLLLAAFLFLSLFQFFFPFYPFRFGDFLLSPLDPVYFLMILKIWRYALKYPRRMGKLTQENFFLMVFLAMVVLYVILYTPIYGKSAIGEARKFYFAFFFPLLGLISIKRPEDLRRLFLVLVRVAFIIALVALVKLGMEGTIMPITRVLNAEETLTLVFVAFAMLVHRIHNIVIVTPLLDKVLLLLFSSLVLVSGQRSCWLAVGLALMLTLWLYRHRSILISKMVMLGLVGLMVGTAAMIMLPETRSRLLERFSGITDPQEDSNASWRMMGWEAQLAQVRQNLFFGEGVGNYYSWHYKESEVTNSPHNAYLQMTLKFGLFGLILYSVLAIQFFRKTLLVRRKLRSGPMKVYIEVAMLTFGASHAYMVGYGIHPFALVFFGMGICAASLSQKALRRSQESRIPPFSADLKTLPRQFPPHRRPAARPLYS